MIPTSGTWVRSGEAPWPGTAEGGAGGAAAGRGPKGGTRGQEEASRSIPVGVQAQPRSHGREAGSPLHLLICKQVVQDQASQSPSSGHLQSVSDKTPGRLRRDPRGRGRDSLLPHLSKCSSVNTWQIGTARPLHPHLPWGARAFVDRGAHSKGRAWQVAGNGGCHALPCPSLLSLRKRVSAVSSGGRHGAQSRAPGTLEQLLLLWGRPTVGLRTQAGEPRGQTFAPHQTWEADLNYDDTCAHTTATPKVKPWKGA